MKFRELEKIILNDGWIYKHIILPVSKLSYGMYLMHIFWLGVWVTLFKYTLALPSVAAIPAIAVATFISCYLTTKLISFIPGSKWIIG